MRSAPHRSNKILIPCKFSEFRLRGISGGKGIRTPDFQLAKLALYQLSYAPALRIAECRLPIADFKKLFSCFLSVRLKIDPLNPRNPRFEQSYQIRARCSGAANILSPGRTLNASYQASIFRVGPMTRN
jgi:hypothetical protein